MGDNNTPAVCRKTFQLDVNAADAPCDLGIPDNTVLEPASTPNPQILNDTKTYITPGIGQYEFAYTGGAYKSDDNPFVGQWKITQEKAIFNNGGTLLNLISGTSYGGANQAAVEGQMNADPTVTLSAYNHVSPIKHQFVGQSNTNFTPGAPNPTWSITRTKKPGMAVVPTKLRVSAASWAQLSPCLVGCTGSAVGGAEPVWTGTMPVADFTAPFVSWNWNADFSLGLQLNGNVIDVAETYHSTFEPTSGTGCAWIFGVDFQGGGGAWAGRGGGGYSPVGDYTFQTDLFSFSLCNQYADVRLATTGVLPPNTFAANVKTKIGVGALPDIDGVSAQVGDRILVKNEAATSENGIYTVTDLGSPATAWKLTRSADADTSAEVKQGFFLKVIAGTVNSGSYWRLVTLDPIALNATGLNFAQIPNKVTIEAF